MITHEILRNYCIFFAFANISFAIFTCVEPEEIYVRIYAMNDKNELLPHHEHTIESFFHIRNASCRRFNIIKICFIIWGLQINWNYHFKVTNSLQGSPFNMKWKKINIKWKNADRQINLLQPWKESFSSVETEEKQISKHLYLLWSCTYNVNAFAILASRAKHFI